MLQDITRVPTVGGIYLIRLSDKHYYGGRSRNIQGRASTHLAKLQEGTHGNLHMQRVFDNYGIFQVEVLKEVSSVEEQISTEQEWLDENFGKPGCLNISLSATGGGHSEETRRKMSQTRRGMTHSPVSIAKMSDLKRRWHQQNPCPVAGKVWIRLNSKRKMIPPEEVPDLVAQGWALGQGGPGFTGTHSEETRKKLRDSSNKGWAWMTRGAERKVVPPEKVSEYAAEGWTHGMDLEDFVYMTRSDGKVKRCKPSEVNLKLQQGWALGKPSWGTQTPEAKEKISKRHKGTKWVRNPETGERKRASPEESEKLLGQGWISGKGPKL